MFLPKTIQALDFVPHVFTLKLTPFAQERHIFPKAMQCFDFVPHIFAFKHAQIALEQRFFKRLYKVSNLFHTFFFYF